MNKQESQTERKGVLIVLYSALFTAMLGLGIVGPLIPLYARDLGATGICLEQSSPASPSQG